MPTYEYEHKGAGCKLGKTFECEQSMKDDAFTKCPECDKPVKRLLSAPFLNTPRGNSDLKSMGFTKLERRDKGVYENVTATGKENRTVKLGDQSTYPDFKKRGLD